MNNTAKINDFSSDKEKIDYAMHILCKVSENYDWGSKEREFLDLAALNALRASIQVNGEKS